MIILRGVNVFPTQIEEQVLATGGLAAHFQIELSREGRLDAMTVLAEALPNRADAAARDAAGAALARLIRERIGIGVSVLVREPGGVERSEGKARRVVDRRGGR